jgi:hypothetical protein
MMKERWVATSAPRQHKIKRRSAQALWLLRSFAGGFPRPRQVERRAEFSFRQ